MGEHTRTYLRSLRLSIEGTRAKEERGKEVAAFYHGAHNTRVSIYPRGEEREVCACVSRCSRTFEIVVVVVPVAVTRGGSHKLGKIMV